MIAQDKPTPVPYDVLLPKPKPDLPLNSPMAMTEQTEVAKATTRKTRAKSGVNTRCKKNARLISRMARNRPKPPVQLEPLAISEDSDSEVERFLAEEYPYSMGLCDKTSCDFVKNSPPYLREDPEFPGIEPPCETLGESSEPLPARAVTPPCDQCGMWLERYYLDVPTLKSKIRDLEDQVARLTGQNATKKSNDKKPRTDGTILFKNCESATAIVSSRLT
jgi:hypothetical protein